MQAKAPWRRTSPNPLPHFALPLSHSPSLHPEQAVEPDNTAAPAALLDALDYMVGMQFQRGRTEYSGMEHDDAEHDTGASHNGGQP